MDVKAKGLLFLELGNVKNMARVTLNGKDFGVVWTAPWHVEISGAVRSKNNELKIEVINLRSNRLIGDEKKSDDGIMNGKWPGWLLKGMPRISSRYTFTTTEQYNANSPLLKSGLMEPVKITHQKNSGLV